MSRRDAVITGGGTSGHVLPAIAVLELLEDSGMPADTLAYVGCRRGVERQLIGATPYVAKYLPMAGLQRSLSLSAIVRNLALPFRIVVSYSIALALALSWRPRVVVSVGGYASAPMSFAAWVLRVPLVCVSYDAIPGLATRRQARHAVLSATAFPESLLPRALHTGAPVRRAIRTLDVSSSRRDARSALDIPDDILLVTVMGGSLGSAVVNDTVQQIVSELAATGEKAGVLHLCGARFANTEPLQVPSSVWYRRCGYEERMASVLAATDVFVCRAGAGSIAEIATVGVASILIPWKDSADGHQLRNARWLGDANAAVVIEENAETSGLVAREVGALVSDTERRNSLARAAWRMGEANRRGHLATAVLSAFARGSRRHA